MFIWKNSIDQLTLSLIQIFQMMPKTVCMYIYIYSQTAFFCSKIRICQKNVGKQNSEIPCDQGWWKFCGRMIWNYCLLWVCCSNHTEEKDLRDVMVQGKTIQFTVFKRSIRFFLTIRVRKSRMSSHINILW